MKNLFKYAASYWKAMIAIVLILVVQAYCDLFFDLAVLVLVVPVLDVINKATLKTDTHRPVHTDQQDNAGGENRQKQFAGNTGSPELHCALLFRREIATF